MDSQDPELKILLEHLFFGRTIEVTQPLQVTVLGTDFGASVLASESTGEQNLAASALDLARQTETRIGDSSNRTANITQTMPIRTSSSRIMGGY
jgi:hypothetical protein